jgi:hypothetical protein
MFVARLLADDQMDEFATLHANMEELYLAFNLISDISDLIRLSKLAVLDLENKWLRTPADAQLLSLCSSLKAVRTCADLSCVFRRGNFGLLSMQKAVRKAIRQRQNRDDFMQDAIVQSE